MIIYEPQIDCSSEEITLSADITITKSSLDMPTKLWYKIPRTHQDLLTQTSDCFVVALVQLAMYLREDIHVKGALSAKLSSNLIEYQKIFHAWQPNIFRKVISITADSYHKETKHKEKNITCSFSGGLDSSYSFYKLLAKYNPIKQDHLTSVLHIKNKLFATPSESLNEKLKQKYQAIVEKHGVKFLTIDTNIEDFKIKSHKDWIILTFGSALTGCVLAYSNGISKYFISSSYDYANLEACGSHPLVDHLLSTESLEIIHHGASLNKVQKTNYISEIPESYTFLKPCTQLTNGHNCGRCGKCVRTMVALELLNKLGSYKTFPKSLQRKTVRSTILNDHNFAYANELVKYARKTGRKDIVFDLYYATVRSKFIVPFLQPIWKQSAKLKAHSKTYENFVNTIKNE